MLNTTDRIIKHKVGLLNLAEEPGKVSKAYQVTGLSRDTFYRYKSAVDEGIILTESQVQAFERKKLDDEACGEIETAHPGYLGSQDTF
jgi:ACT domain-containing protein